MNRQRYLRIRTLAGESSVPIISRELLSELMLVEPSGVQPLGEYRPCQVELKGCSVADRVYVAEAVSYAFWWGVWPEQDPGKRAISILDVKRIQESPSRLPARLANKLYEGGETFMGGVAFGLVLRDGRRISALTGNAVDFLEYPPGVTAHDVVDVLHGWRDTGEKCHGANYSWCLYCLEPDETKKLLSGRSNVLAQHGITWDVAP